MKRLIIRHCRDNAVLKGYRWDLWCKDTDDPHGEPLYVGYGSFNACHDIVLWLLMLKASEVPSFTWAGFSSAMSDVVS